MVNTQKYGTTKNIKIFKSATHMSILDVTSALDYHQTKDSDVLYKGNIVFIINEYGKSKVQLQAFLPKSTAKMVTHLIQNHMFHNVFPQGYKKYGGSPSTNRARVLTIEFEADKQRYKFQIEEGQGQRIKNGAMKMVKREKTVQTYVSLPDALELSHEVLDFIKHQELIGMLNDKPLFSYSTYQQRNEQTNDYPVEQVAPTQQEQHFNNHFEQSNYQQQQYASNNFQQMNQQGYNSNW